MEIIKKEIYQLDGKTYNHLQQIKNEVETGIGNLICSINRELNPNEQLTPKQKLKLFDMITHNRSKLIKLLNVTIDISEDPLHENIKNILDYPEFGE